MPPSTIMSTSAEIYFPVSKARTMADLFVDSSGWASWADASNNRTVDLSLETAAWQLWEARADKDWSAVDCASFQVMQQRGLTEALTTDHHFEQAGFQRILK